MNIHNPPNLTKENFWNRMKEQYPLSMESFCKFIDEYKKTVGWNGLFNELEIASQSFKTFAPKFHDVPYHFQLGVWIAFMESRGGCHMEVDMLNYDLKEDIEGFFKEIYEEEMQAEKELNDL